jgi:hypothetical protein
MTNALPEGAYDYVSDKDGFVVTSSNSQVSQHDCNNEAAELSMSMRCEANGPHTISH